MKTKRLLSLKCIFYVGLVFLGPYSFAQNEKQINELSESTSEINEEHDTQNLNKLLIDYNKDQQKVLNDAKKMLSEKNADESGDESDGEAFTNQSRGRRKKIKSDEDNASLNLKNVKYSEAVKIALAPLQKMSESELSKLLGDNIAGSTTKKILSKYPSIIHFTVRLIKDKLAIPSLAKIIDDEKRLIRFSLTMLSTFLISIVLKYLLKKSGRTILMAISLWFLRFIIMCSIRMGIIVYFFSQELAPTFKIAMDLLFKD